MPRRLRPLVARLASRGVRLQVHPSAGQPFRVGPAPERATVRFASHSAFAALEGGDHLALAEAYLRSEVEIEGALVEALRVVEALDLEASLPAKLGAALRALLTNGRRLRGRSIAFHYDRPVDFFLPWFERWRSYSHGLYSAEHDDPAEAQARKFQAAIDALGLAEGSRVLDVGSGWGGFLEYAGQRGIHVHGITLSQEQERFLAQLVREHSLPATIERNDFFDVRSERPFDAAVFMGSFEHLSDYRRVARHLRGLLAPGARIWADFCAQRESFQVGAFLARYVWPGSSRYVDVSALLDALLREGFDVESLQDDSDSYAWTTRDWALRLEAVREPLASKFGEEAVRVFLLYLWGSHHFLRTRRTQAYHLVAGRGPSDGA